MSKVSFDIGDQSPSAHCRMLIEPTTSPSPRSDDDRVESWSVTEPDNEASLAVVLTGVHLLNIVSIVAFGAWKVISTGSEGWISVSKTEFALMTLAGVILYYLQLLKEDSPGIYPSFFQVDLAPPIWKFVYRSEVYFFLLSLLPLQPTVATLQSALDFRQRLELGNRSPGSHTVAQKAVLITAIMGLIFAILPTLQQLTKVLHLRTLHRLLVHEIVTLSLLAMWAASYFYVLFNIVTSVDYISEEDDKYLFGYTMTIIPFALLLPRIEESVIAPLWFRLLKGVLVVVVLFAWVLSKKFRNLYYVLFVCGVMMFFLLRFLTAAAATLRTWHDSNRRCSVQDDTDSLC